jgi:hypothetical protein
LINMVDFGMNAGEAISSPRMSSLEPDALATTSVSTPAGCP